MTNKLNIRGLIYWTVDRLRKRGVADQLRDISECFASPGICQRRTAHRLDDLLRHATTNTAFYSEWRGCRNLEDFPVLQKRSLKERQDDFMSRAYERSRLAVKATSGSYGIPLRTYMSPEKRARQWAEVMFFSRWAGYEVGRSYIDVTNYAGRSRWNHFVRNRVPCNPGHLPENWAREQRAKILRSGACVVIGYPSALRLIADECLRRGDTPEEIGLTGIITTAEPLFEDTRTILQRAFDCPVMSRYAAHETGVVAHEHYAPGRHVINRASYVVEVLKEGCDAPAELGERGRIVVTDLFSHAMPLIRYEIGDSSCSLAAPDADEWPILGIISGRAVERIFDVGGVPIVPERLAYEMRNFDRVRQFQFVQTAAGRYVVRLVVSPDFVDEDAVRRCLGELVGDQWAMSFEYHDAIPALPSGKRPCIVNETSPRQDVLEEAHASSAVPA